MCMSLFVFCFFLSNFRFLQTVLQLSLRAHCKCHSWLCVAISDLIWFELKYCYLNLPVCSTFVWQSQIITCVCSWWPAEVCRFSLLSECGVKDFLSNADAEFAVRLFGCGLLYASHHGRYFYFRAKTIYCELLVFTSGW